MIFLFCSNTPYSDEKRGFYTRNDAFHLILMSDFDFTPQKMKKIDIFFDSLLFLTLKYYFFGHFRLPVRSDTTLSTRTRHFPITYRKPFGSISNLWPVKWSSVFGILKKCYLREYNFEIIQLRFKSYWYL